MTRWLRYLLALWRGFDVHVFDRGDDRLGRQQRHDPRSWLYGAHPIIGRRPKLPTRPIEHTRHAPIWDQGQLGSCTGNAGAGMMMTAPFWVPGRAWDEAKAVELYSLATRNDEPDIPGHYPPQDTGSSALGIGKALASWKVITGYRWAFGLRQVLAVLAVQPGIAGLPWYDSMMTPDAGGVVRIAHGAKVIGGHEIELVGVDPTTQLVKFAQSWGPSWGDRGYGYMSWSTLDRLLSEGGDFMTVTV